MAIHYYVNGEEQDLFPRFVEYHLNSVVKVAPGEEHYEMFKKAMEEDSPTKAAILKDAEEFLLGFFKPGYLISTKTLQALRGKDAEEFEFMVDILGVESSFQLD